MGSWLHAEVVCPSPVSVLTGPDVQSNYTDTSKAVTTTLRAVRGLLRQETQPWVS